MATKVTYTLDDETVDRVRKLAQRQRKPQSQIVREAVAQYAAGNDKLTPEEQAHMLHVLRSLGPQLPTRSRGQVEDELREIREGRRSGWSRPSDPEE